jgi:hypothetical protein
MPRKLQPISNAIQVKLEEARVARLATLDAELRIPYRASLFCVRWQGFLLGGGRETEACCTREARAAAAHHCIATNCTRCRRVPGRLGAALVHPGAWEGAADSELSTPGTCPGHPSAPSGYPQYAAAMLPDDSPVIRITPERITSWGRI